ncbi:hypothetical protein L226DRAFT_119582 [Lentinus tigrinus ALCF2SS1-7]|uniref:uncharacterized protein n=1 Tax=Lentinus tigrinus ALCF2SS1-7 TaxID=1328758 RepID=UPI001166239A|nr:hypothetical protein L226DRAFT_119582 [Lentinus tigrinus ALCF2SS1-7]
MTRRLDRAHPADALPRGGHIVRFAPFPCSLLPLLAELTIEAYVPHILPISRNRIWAPRPLQVRQCRPPPVHHRPLIAWRSEWMLGGERRTKIMRRIQELLIRMKMFLSSYRRRPESLCFHFLPRSFLEGGGLTENGLAAGCQSFHTFWNIFVSAQPRLTYV